MQKFLLVKRILVLPLLLLFPSTVFADNAESLKQGIVRINAETREGTQRIGAGFIIERERDFAVIVTASALVEGTQQILVDFSAAPDSMLPASVIEMEGGDPQGLASLSVEGEIPPASLTLELNERVPLYVGDAVFTMGFSNSENSWQMRKAELISRAGRTLSFSRDAEVGQYGSPLVKHGQVVGVVTEVKENIASATPAAIAAYVLESWGIGSRRLKVLTGTLAAESIALLLQVKSKTPEERKHFWPALISQEKRADLLQRSLLLAIESMRLSPSREAQKALNAGLGLLLRPLITYLNEKTNWGSYEVAFSPDGQFLATAHGTSGLAKIWSVKTGKEVANFHSDSDLTSVTFSPDGRYLATAGSTETAQVWEIISHNKILSLNHDGTLTSIAFSPDSKMLLTTSDDKDSRYAHIWDITNGHGKRWHLPIERHRGVAIVRDTKGVYLAAITTRGAKPYLWVWEMITGKLIWQREFDQTIRGIAFSPDGIYLATTAVGKPTQVWSLSKRQEVLRIPGGSGKPIFSPDGRYLALKGHLEVKVWDLTRGKNHGELLFGQEVTNLRHEESVRAVAFSPDGKYIATGGIDATVRVWEFPSGREVARMSHINKDSRLEYYGILRDIVFSPDGHSLVSRDQHGRTRLWRLFPEELVVEACNRLERNLTPGEWQRYLGDEPYRKTCEEKP